MPKTLIESQPGSGNLDKEVQASELTARLAGPVAYVKPVPFALSGLVGRVNRTQGIKRARPGLTHDKFLYVQFDRVGNDLDGRKETLSDLAQKGHTVQMVNQGQPIDSQSDYAPGFVWLSYGNSGTNDGPYDFDHNPGLVLRTSLETIHTRLQAIIPARNSSEFCYMVANFEQYDFVGGGGPTPNFWDSCPAKNDPFISPFDGATHTLQDLYNAGGIDLLNAHMKAKRAILNTLWVKIFKQKNQGLQVTNGDAIPVKSFPPNGDIQYGNMTYPIRNYKSIPYEILRAWVSGSFGGMEPIRGGNVTIGSIQYNLTGLECEQWDFFSQYYYYMEVYCRRSDHAELMSTNDPTKLTVDYWQQKFWFHRDAMYVVAGTYELRRWFLQKHKEQGGKDMLGLRVFDMHEHMYEANFAYLTSDTSNRCYPSGVNYDDHSAGLFMRWITAGNQKLYIHFELIKIRLLSDVILLGGTIVWWEGQGPINYAAGKYAQFQQRSQEMHQQVYDALLEDSDIWVKDGSETIILEGVPMRYRQNGGAWTSFGPSISPVQARYGTSAFRPYIIGVEKANKVFLGFATGQEDNDITDIEFQYYGQTFSVKLTGCVAEHRAIRQNLPTA